MRGPVGREYGIQDNLKINFLLEYHAVKKSEQKSRSTFIVWSSKTIFYVVDSCTYIHTR